jgi:hypothetical protein
VSPLSSRSPVYDRFETDRVSIPSRSQDSPLYRPGLYTGITACLLNLVLVAALTTSFYFENGKAERGEKELEINDVSSLLPCPRWDRDIHHWLVDERRVKSKANLSCRRRIIRLVSATPINVKGADYVVSPVDGIGRDG